MAPALVPLLLALTLAACDVPIGGLGGDLGGPFAGNNRVTALALDPAHPLRVYLGTRLGLFVSGDGGAHWPAAGRGVFADAGVRGLSASPLPGGPLWLVAGDDTPWLSRDGGQSWRPAGGTAGGRTGDLPAGASWVQAGAASPDQAYAAVPGRGLYASDDAGLTWRALPPLPPKGEPRRLVVDPAAPTQLLLLMTQGLARSTDGGAHWQVLPFAGQPAGAPLALAASPAQPGVAYYATEAALYRTADMGVTFAVAGAGHRFTLLAGGSGGDTVYGVDGLQVLRSVDGGRTWALATATAETVGALAAGGAAGAPDDVYAGLDSPAGFLASGDGGASWRQSGG